MTGSASSPSGMGRPPRRRQFPFGLVMLIFGFGLGVWAGVAGMKRALTGPVWVQRTLGLPAAYQPSAPVTPAVPAASITPPTAPVSPSSPAASPGMGSHIESQEKPKKPEMAKAAETSDLAGSWEITDSVVADGDSSSNISTYIFRGDNTGEFDSNGKKLYEFHWKPSGDDISVEYDGEGPEGVHPWLVKLKWSLNDDRSVLTLIPEGGKDARSFLYSVGPGVYHRKL